MSQNKAREDIFFNRRISNTQQGKIHNIWHLIKNDQTCKEARTIPHNEEKNQSSEITQIKLIEKDIKIVTTTTFDMVRKIEENVSRLRRNTEEIQKTKIELLEMKNTLNGINRLDTVEEKSNVLENTATEKIRLKYRRKKFWGKKKPTQASVSYKTSSRGIIIYA